ncbi:Methyltransferase domain-containing protein [Streptomyces sp. Ag82_O1-12]|uniref:methyltransferase domain-containing protein n=1 Tax=unclassified Streptomyces TaxID=2593676 RepID=UPI000BDD1669|nr:MULTISPECIES: class I SAM-dependent methyltransferase [unclassified Streptomyces]SMQ20273.1 Methyltransferase domain-containing protein [Streptomyces sp. Ag82_O1-12]SOD49188.1 Methyltransferase domain-containing protein [Streptomyces sp. Ag82_G6-1]
MTNPATTTQQGGAIPAQPGPREVTGGTDSATPGTKPGSGQAVAADVPGVVPGGPSGRIGGESAARATEHAAVPGLGSSVAFGPGHVPGAVIPGAGPSGKPGSRPTVKLREANPDDPPRYAPEWLELREPADAAGRAHDLLDPLRIRLANMPGKSGVVIHDLGCGTGSMGRWLASRLDGAQHWILHDRDPYLLHFAAVSSPRSAADGSRVTVETRRGDVARLTPDALQGASLVTASALLDVLTREEIDTLAAACAGAGCPALLTLSVAGRVELTPPHPLDAELVQAFNDHQRRDGLLGPDAVTAAAEAFSEHGATVRLHPSPWRLGPEQAALTEQWLRGWVGAAVEERPELRAEADVYLTNRLAALAAGELRVTVHHVDLLALSRPGGGAS